jgi:hypothetical protein
MRGGFTRNFPGGPAAKRRSMKNDVTTCKKEATTRVPTGGGTLKSKP